MLSHNQIKNNFFYKYYLSDSYIILSNSDKKSKK